MVLVSQVVRPQLWDCVVVTLPTGSSFMAQITGRFGETWLVTTEEPQRNQDGSFGQFYSIPESMIKEVIRNGVPTHIPETGWPGSPQLPTAFVFEGTQGLDRHRSPTHTAHSITVADELKRLFHRPGVKAKAAVLERRQARRESSAGS